MSKPKYTGPKRPVGRPRKPRDIEIIKKREYNKKVRRKKLSVMKKKRTTKKKREIRKY